MNISRGADCCVPHNKSFNASVDYTPKRSFNFVKHPVKISPKQNSALSRNETYLAKHVVRKERGATRNGHAQ
jgi:hypothetical protein